ncbi:ATPase, T2SS/T4P/T4SS family [Vibrio hepatarius]|uniref:ATPase, T2SS/T4P/T4SS family n=1 Tax=Vibrio hepatarius TaxID=171383 RepID=UPI001C08BB75|nr:ATPase, T2SS/T4P/T4SS family [Vibrio hepatarius]MBU2896047.1 GspE family protein [Vibrio hepatarius]
MNQPKAVISESEVLDFSDIYIHLKEPETKSYMFFKRIRQTVDVNADSAPHIKKMADIIKKKHEETKQLSFRIAYLKRLYRVTMIKSVDGTMAECRAQPRQLISLSKLGLPPQVKNWTLNERLCKGGLILVVGAVGSGKTTTCAAIAKARVELFGGVLLTIEDPAELPMHGRIGNGLCVQYEIETKEDFLEAGRLALRCYPADKAGIMFIGEIRDSKSASLALRASLDGRLVVATIHGDSVISALQRLISYSTEEMSINEAYSLLQNGFRLCLHQEWVAGQLKVQFLADTQAAAKTIKQQKIDLLGSELYAQQTKLINNEPIKLREI